MEANQMTQEEKICRKRKRDEMYWKAFVSFLLPTKPVETLLSRQRSFEYMELNANEFNSQTASSEKIGDADVTKSDGIAKTVAEDTTQAVESSAVYLTSKATSESDTSQAEKRQVSNNNNNLVDNVHFQQEAPAEDEQRTSEPVSSQEATTVQTPETAAPSLNERRNCSVNDASSRVELWMTGWQENPICLKLHAKASFEEDDGSDDFYQPTLSVIIEVDEGSCCSQQLDVENCSCHELDEPVAMGPKSGSRRCSEEWESSHSFGSSLRRSSTIDNLNVDEDAVCNDSDASKSLAQDHAKAISSQEQELAGYSGDVDEAEYLDHSEDANYSNLSSPVDSAYSSREGVNILHHSSPDLLRDSMEDLQYIPVSYAESSLRRKKKRWPTFAAGDTTRNSNAPKRKFSSLRKRLSRKLSKRASRSKKATEGDRGEKLEDSDSSLPHRQSSFRRIIMRVIRTIRKDDRPGQSPLRPTRQRSWSLPSRNQRLASLGVLTDDSDVIVSEFAII